VRKKPCACAACIDQDWANCDLKGHVDEPVLLVLKQKKSKKKEERVLVQAPGEGDWQLFVERGAVYGVRTDSGLLIFRCERLGVEEVVGFEMEVLDGQPGNTIQLQVTTQGVQVNRSQIIGDVDVSGNLKMDREAYEDLQLLAASDS